MPSSVKEQLFPFVKKKKVGSLTIKNRLARHSLDIDFILKLNFLLIRKRWDKISKMTKFSLFFWITTGKSVINISNLISFALAVKTTNTRNRKGPLINLEERRLSNIISPAHWDSFTKMKITLWKNDPYILTSDHLNLPATPQLHFRPNWFGISHPLIFDPYVTDAWSRSIFGPTVPLPTYSLQFI